MRSRGDTVTGGDRLEDVTLRAKLGEPLADASVARVVEATAHAVAERTGVDLVAVHVEPASITATLRGPVIVAIGFAAELRRLTEGWYRGKHGVSLWGDVTTPGTDVDPGAL